MNIGTMVTIRCLFDLQVCSLVILDDPQMPTVEGTETFLVNLNSVHNAYLSPPHEALVTINDTTNDGKIPFFNFKAVIIGVKTCRSLLNSVVIAVTSFMLSFSSVLLIKLKKGQLLPYPIF